MLFITILSLPSQACRKLFCKLFASWQCQLLLPSWGQRHDIPVCVSQGKLGSFLAYCDCLLSTPELRSGFQSNEYQPAPVLVVVWSSQVELTHPQQVAPIPLG